MKERAQEAAARRGTVTSLKETAKHQVAGFKTSPTHDLGLRGPTIQIVDPSGVITRGDPKPEK